VSLPNKPAGFFGYVTQSYEPRLITM